MAYKIIQAARKRVGPDDGRAFLGSILVVDYIRWMQIEQAKLPVEFRSIATISFSVECDDLFSDQDVVCHDIYMNLEYVIERPEEKTI